MGRHGEALREYSGVRRLGDPRYGPAAYARLAQIMAGRSQYAAAADLACMAAAAAAPAAGRGGRGGDKAAACISECAGLCSKCGDALRERGRYDGAASCYKKALSIDPGSGGGHCGNGDILAMRGRPADALVHYSLALKTGETVRALVGSGNALYDMAREKQAPKERRECCQRAERMFARAARIEPENFAARMGAGKACLEQKSDDKLEEAESHFVVAAGIRPGDANARMGAGKAARRRAMRCEERGDAGGAAECYRRAMAHYDRCLPMHPAGGGGAVAAGYWKGVCMLHLGGPDGASGKKFLRGVLDRATPVDGAEASLCGKICDILGEYGSACGYYVESLKDSSLYPAGFYGRIDAGRIHAGRRASAAAAAAAPAGGGARTGPDAYVLDANVAIGCASQLDPARLDPDVVSILTRGIKDGDCRIPQAAFDEAYGRMHGRDKKGLDTLCRWGAPLASMRDRYWTIRCMRRAREALMTAWLYSDMKDKAEWRRRKFGRNKAPYAGGPPAGKDVVILATAAYLHESAGEQGPRRTRLVTSDADFHCFEYYIREVLSIDVVDPIEASGLLARGALEGERREQARTKA